MNAKLAAARDAAKATQSKFVRARHVLNEALDDYSQALADWETAKATMKALVKKAAKNTQKAVKGKR